MRFRNPIIYCALLGALPFAAQAWEHDMQRGVDLYQTLDAEISVPLVCDPNSVHGTTVSAVMIGFGAELDVSEATTFRFPDLIIIQASLDHGRISKSVNAGGAWEPLVAGFRTHGSVEIMRGDTSYNVNLGEILPFSCI
jgi:hypothetical protein